MINLKNIVLLICSVFIVFFAFCKKDSQNKNAQAAVSDDLKKVENDTVKGLPGFDFNVIDKNLNEILEVNEELTFVLKSPLDITESNKIFWQLEDGEKVQGAEVGHSYKKEGQYLVTLLLDEKLLLEKQITIAKIQESSSSNSLVKIHGPSYGIVGENLVFRASGPDLKYWAWEFGERLSMISSESGGQAVHKYKTPGKYTIKLNTNASNKPVHHNITIDLPFAPPFEIVRQEIDTIKMYAEDIKTRLQKIADANVNDKSTFNTHFNYIKKKYLCKPLERVVVVTNGSRYNDFFNYCRGIHNIDTKKNKVVTIQEVKIDTYCVNRIEISQIEQFILFE